MILNFLLILIFFFSSLIFLLRNPIFSVICLAFVFICAIMILLLLGVEFLALSILIIYVGAIIVLFLFIIMMLNIRLFPKLYFPDIMFVNMLILIKFTLFSSFFILDSFHIISQYCQWRLEQKFVTTFFYKVQFQFIDIYSFSNLLYYLNFYSFFCVGLLLLLVLIAVVAICQSILPILNKVEK